MVYTHLAAAIAGAAIAFAGAWQIQSWRFDSAELHRVEAEREQKRFREKTATAAGLNYEADKERIRVVYEVIDKSVREIIERPVYRNDCIDGVGLLRLNEAIDRTRAASQPAATVPSTE